MINEILAVLITSSISGNYFPDFKNIISNNSMIPEKGEIIKVSDNNDELEAELYAAIQYGDIKMLKELISKGVSLNPQGKLLAGQTPLIWAVNAKNFEIIKVLITNGADVNGKNVVGSTALIYSTRVGDPEIVKYLVDKGAKVNIKDSLLVSPLMNTVSVENETEEVSAKELEIVKFLIEKGANINELNKDGESVLVYAIMQGNFELVKFLVEKGADIHLKNVNETSIFMNAAYFHNLEIVKYLVDKGANIKDKDGNGATALMYTIIGGGNLPLVKYLVEIGVDVNSKGYDGATALSLAKENGNREIVDYLKMLEKR
jgi:ankyrin repeat protein